MARPRPNSRTLHIVRGDVYSCVIAVGLDIALLNSVESMIDRVKPSVGKGVETGINHIFIMQTSRFPRFH